MTQLALVPNTNERGPRFHWTGEDQKSHCQCGVFTRATRWECLGKSKTGAPERARPENTQVNCRTAGATFSLTIPASVASPGRELSCWLGWYWPDRHRCA